MDIYRPFTNSSMNFHLRRSLPHIHVLYNYWSYWVYDFVDLTIISLVRSDTILLHWWPSTPGHWTRYVCWKWRCFSGGIGNACFCQHFCGNGHPQTSDILAFWPRNMVHTSGAQFACRHVTAQWSKFDHVISSLAPEYAAKVHNLVLRPPEECPYDVLKEQLIHRTTASEQRSLQQLFTSEELGDRKPTQLLRRIQQLIRPGIADSSFLRGLFLQRLPPNPETSRSWLIRFWR